MGPAARQPLIYRHGRLVIILGAKTICWILNGMQGDGVSVPLAMTTKLDQVSINQLGLSRNSDWSHWVRTPPDTTQEYPVCCPGRLYCFGMK